MLGFWDSQLKKTYQIKNYNICWLQCATHTILVSLQRRPFVLYYPSSRIDNAQKDKMYRDWSGKKVFHTECKKLIIAFQIKIHEISPGAIQKSNGLKVTCLMSIYFKSEDDTMKILIFLRLYKCSVRGPLLFLTKPGLAVDAFVSQYYTKLVCTACIHKFSKYILYKLSIEKQPSIVDAWGLDLQNDI